MNYSLRLLQKDESIMAIPMDEHIVQCNHCDTNLVMCGHPDQMPDGPTVTPPGMGDDDWEENERGQMEWECQLCRMRAVTTASGFDE